MELTHEPTRLLAVAAPTERISAIAHRNTVLQHLFFHRWVALVALVALEPETGEWLRLTDTAD